MIYLTISEGEAGDATTPLIATSDPLIIAAVVRELAKRVHVESGPVRLTTMRSRGEPSGDIPR